MVVNKELIAVCLCEAWDVVRGNHPYAQMLSQNCWIKRGVWMNSKVPAVATRHLFAPRFEAVPKLPHCVISPR